jgi:hypothetical protein
MKEKKQHKVEAITFNALVEFGKNNGANIVDNMPWSFEYKGYQITHENDECYLIPTPVGTKEMTPKHMLFTDIKGNIFPYKIEYEPIRKEQQFLLSYHLHKRADSGNGNYALVTAGSLEEAELKLIKKTKYMYIDAISSKEIIADNIRCHNI